MKTRIFLFVAVLIATAFSGMAQSTNTIMLLSNGQIKTYTRDGFLDAYNAANSGDTIYLTSGYYSFDGFPETTFESGTTARVFSKALTIIGSSANEESSNRSYIGWGDLYIDLSTAGGNISFEGVHHGGTIWLNVGSHEMAFRNCRLDDINIESAGNSLVIDRSRMYTLRMGDGLMNNVKGNNSIIDNVYGACADGQSFASFDHCKFNSLYENDIYAYVRNSYVEWIGGENLAFDNCFYKYKNGDESVMTLVDCTEIDGSIDVDSLNLDKEAAESYGFYGSDGTVAGVMGGTQPYTLSPSYPTPDIENSSVTYDSVNKKLNVKVKVLTD